MSQCQNVSKSKKEEVKFAGKGRSTGLILKLAFSQSIKELISGDVLLPESGGILPVTIMVTKDNYLVKMITIASTIYLKQPFKSPPSQLQSKQSLYITNVVSTKMHLKTKHATHTTTKQP